MHVVGARWCHHWYWFSLCSHRLIKKGRDFQPLGSCKCYLHTTGNEMVGQCTLGKWTKKRSKVYFYKYNGSRFLLNMLKRKWFWAGSWSKQEVDLSRKWIQAGNGSKQEVVPSTNRDFCFPMSLPLQFPQGMDKYCTQRVKPLTGTQILTQNTQTERQRTCTTRTNVFWSRLERCKTFLLKLST